MNTLKNTNLDFYKNIALQRKGNCLSKKYINKSTKLTWECHLGHRWEATPSSINRGRWCPKCHIYRNEEICRITFEQIFNCEFLKSRPKWLINSKGNRMELDGYSRALNIAFEYQGEQHFKKTFFTKNNNLLNKRKKDDLRKVILCKKKNIFLFVITYKDNVFQLPDIIKQQSKKNGFSFNLFDLNKKINYDKIYFGEHEFEKLKEKVKNNKGEILSKTYLGSSVKLEFKCELGHVWKAVPNNIIKEKGTWCPFCSETKNQKLTIEEMQIIAEGKEGKCISKKYIDNSTKLTWECHLGHRWPATPNVITQGSWCPKCAGNQKLTIEYMQSIAKKKKGKCLSKIYENVSTVLEWECHLGHRWKVAAKTTLNGSWCPKCYGNIKLTIEEMQTFANKKMGKCISKNYIDNSKKLTWECHLGHRWDATPNSISMGSWCPDCSGLRKLTIEQMNSIASKNKGKCISKKYVNARTKLTWQCHLGHRWEAVPSSVKKGSWCPYCSGNRRLN